LPLAIFDLDNTLLADDSDHLWGQFLAEKGIVDAEHYAAENDRFYREYQEGKLDIFEFLRFSLHPLSQNDPEQLRAWRTVFLEEKIAPVILPASYDLLSRHRDAGDVLVIITATNAFVTEPIARLFGVVNLIATEPQQINGRYTGGVSGTPCFREGKVIRIMEWMKIHRQTFEGSTFYSDSHNDIPLLERVANPVAVDPDIRLNQHARSRMWPIITLRDGRVPRRVFPG